MAVELNVCPIGSRDVRYEIVAFWAVLDDSTIVSTSKSVRSHPRASGSIFHFSHVFRCFGVISIKICLLPILGMDKRVQRTLEGLLAE